MNIVTTSCPPSADLEKTPVRIELSPIRIDYTPEELSLIDGPLYDVREWIVKAMSRSPITLDELMRLRTGR